MSTAPAKQKQREQQLAALERVLLGMYDNSMANEPVPAQPQSETPNVPEPDLFFAENITFRDPFFRVTGIQDYRAQFAQLHAMFPEIKLEVLSSSWSTGKGGLAKSGAPEGVSSRNKESDANTLTVDAVCTYKVNKWISIRVRQVTIARVDESGRFCEHEDLWSIADIIESLPLIGRLYRWVQPMAGRLVSAIIKKRWASKAGVKAGNNSFNSATLHAVYHPVQSQRHGKELAAVGGASQENATLVGLKTAAQNLQAQALDAVHSVQAQALHVTQMAQEKGTEILHQGQKLADNLRNRGEHKQREQAVGDQKRDL